MIHKWQWRVARWAAGGLAACLVCTLACGAAVFFTINTTSLGRSKDSIFGPGTVSVAIVNNTGFFVSLTFGAFDPLNEELVPEYEQFLAEADEDAAEEEDEEEDETEEEVQYLEPGSTSNTYSFTCARAVSLGDRDLINAIRDRDPEADLNSLQEGITFSDKLLSDSTAQQFTLNGVANQVQYLGVNYQAESLIVFTLEPDESQAYGVRIDVEILLP